MIKIKGLDELTSLVLDFFLKLVFYLMSPIWGSHQKRKLNTDFLNLLVNRINNGLSSFENELNSIPKEYRKQFIELYEKSRKTRND